MLIAGGILHDIGKIYEFSYDQLIDYSDEGRLIGHIVMGVEMLDKKIDAIPDFPPQLSLELRHILLSHHGEFEFGSPKRPKTMEALVVHYIDDLDAKRNVVRGIAKIRRVIQQDWPVADEVAGGAKRTADSAGGPIEHLILGAEHRQTLDAP